MRRRLPARVYWVRRGLVLVLLAVLVTVVVLVVRAVAVGGPSVASTGARQSGQSGPSSPNGPTSPSSPTTAASSGTPSVPPSPSQTVATHAGGITDCPSASLQLGITPGAASFAAGVSPTFTLTIATTSTAACLLDAGVDYREVVVTSGSDRVWSSRDCAAANADPRTLLLTAGHTDSTQLAWNLVRSATGCPSGLAAPGPGTYQAQFSVGGATAPLVTFTLAAPAPPTETSAAPAPAPTPTPTAKD